MCRLAKFCEYRSSCCRDMEIFIFFKMADGPPHFGFVMGVWTTHKEYLVAFIIVSNDCNWPVSLDNMKVC